MLTAGLVVIANVTHDRIARNQQAWIKEHLDALVAPQSYDNDPLADTIEITSPGSARHHRPGDGVSHAQGRDAGGRGHSLDRAGWLSRSARTTVAIAPGGQLLGVQVIRHNETPGLGDAFENRDADWLDRFRGLSLTKPPQQQWSVRRDGGDFDAFTGATITPRAIVKAVRRTLEFYQGNEERLYKDGKPQ